MKVLERNQASSPGTLVFREPPHPILPHNSFSDAQTTCRVDQIISFKPLNKLYCYVVDNYDKGIFMPEMENKPIQTLDLMTLPPETTWYLTVDGSTGQYSLTNVEPDGEAGHDSDHQ